MSDQHTIQNYLNAQGLTLAQADVHIALTGLKAITTLDSTRQAEILNIPVPVDAQTTLFNHGLLQLDNITPRLSSLSEQQSRFIQICALLDSVNDQQSHSCLCLYIAPPYPEEHKPNPPLHFCAGLYHTQADKKRLHALFTPNAGVTQVAQTLWCRVVKDITKWQQLHQEQNPVAHLATGSEIALPVYTTDETLLGILYSHNERKNAYPPEAQALLVALALALSEQLTKIHWQ